MSVGSSSRLIASRSAGAILPQLFVIDPSVASKWYVPESGSAEAKLDMKPGLKRHAPDSLPLEAAPALLKRTRSSNPRDYIPRRNAQLIMDVLRDSSLIQYCSCSALLEPAMALALEVGASVYDGLFLALAIEKNGRVVTADRPFHDKIVASQHSLFVRWFLDPP